MTPILLLEMLPATLQSGHHHAGCDRLGDRELRFLHFLPSQNGAGVPLAVQAADDGYRLGMRQIVDAELVEAFDMP